MGKQRLISKKVRVLDCTFSFNGSKQGEAFRFDSNYCKVRTEKGKRGAVEQQPTEYYIPTIFMIPPKKRK